MTLSDAEALDLLISPKNLPEKAEALRWQSRVRFHGLTVRDKAASAHWPTFRSWVFGFLLMSDKRDMFDAIFPFPTPCTSLLAEVQDSFMKVFDSVNPHLEIEAADGIEAALLNYLDESGEPDFWRDEAIAALFESHEDLLLIDIKPGINGRPAPYLVRVPLDSVVSVGFNSDATATHLAYNASDGSIVLVDDVSYRVYTKNERGVYVLAPGDTYYHNLGACPVRKLWDERVPNHPIASASIVDECLSLLDEYAYFFTATNMLKLFGANPIYYGAAQQDEPEPESAQIHLNSDGTPDAGFPGACFPAPKASNSFVAPGDYFEIPPGGDLSVPPVGIVSPDVAGLEFQTTDIKDQRAILKEFLIGTDGEMSLMNKAVNEKQITSGFVDKQTRLLYLSRHLSSARQWAVFTIGKLLYGDKLKKVDHSFGTEFYLQTEDELWAGLKTAKDAGSPRTILYEKIQGIESFRLRTGGNPTRSQILMDLEPLVESTVLELQGLAALGFVPPETVSVKVQFTDLIRLMERTFGVDITQIAVLVPYQERIERLKQFLYANAKYTRPEPVSPASGAGA